MEEYAPGIPSKSTRHPFPTVAEPKTFEFGLHHHFSEGAAKEHYDLRIGDPETGHAHSWAMKYWPKPGEKRLAVPQPTHTVPYMDFEGRIESGYGKGEVHLARRDKTEVTSASPDHVRFNVYTGKGVEEYLLHKTKDDWLIHNVTTTRQVGRGAQIPDAKPRYKAVEPDKLDTSKPGTILQAKIDGAHVLYQFGDKGSQSRVFSYRPTERETGIIEHTQRVPNFHEMKSPSGMSGTILRGELYAADKNGKALPPERVGGILNAGVWKSRQKQEAEGKLIPLAFDVVQWRGKNVEHEPYGKRLELLREATRKAPWITTPRMAVTPEDKQKLFADVEHRREPTTEEGVIEWDLHSNKPPVKAKFRDETDVFVQNVFHEKGQRGLAGGFEYSLTKDGPIAGRIGTGMSHALKKDLKENPDKYKGLQARTLMQRGYAGRAPAFISFHLDQDLPEGIKMASPSLSSFVDELEKIALPRYEKEIAAGNIGRADVAPGVMDVRSGPLGAAARKVTRERLAAPAPVGPEALASRRALNERQYHAQAAAPWATMGHNPNISKKPLPGAFAATMPGMGGTTVYAPPQSGAFLRGLGSGPVGKGRSILGALAPQHAEKLLPGAAPVDPTLNKAVLQHELGEVADLAKPTWRPFASHIGPEPILRENLAVQGDPEAMQHMKALRMSNPDDAMVQRAIRHVGGTPDAPVPIGGRQHRAIEQYIDRHAGELNSANKGKRLVGAVLSGKQIGYASPETHAAAKTLFEGLPQVGRAPGIMGKVRAARGLLPAARTVNKFIRG